MGRDYTPTFWNISRFNAFGTNGVGAASNLIYGFDGLSGTAPSIVLWVAATTSKVTNSATGKFVIPGGSTVTGGQGSSATEFSIYHAF